MPTVLYTVDPLFYSNSNIGVYRGIHYFLIFALKHRLWEIVMAEAVSTCNYKLFMRKKKKNNYNFSSEFFIFVCHEKSQYISLTCLRNGVP